MYPKNNASPPVFGIGAVVQISDGALQTSAVLARVKIGAGAWGAAGGSLDCDTTSAIWSYIPSQAETNAESFIVALYKAGCISIEKTIVPSAASVAGQAALQTATQASIDATQTAAVRLTAARAQAIDDLINGGRLDLIFDTIAADALKGRYIFDNKYFMDASDSKLKVYNDAGTLLRTALLYTDNGTTLWTGQAAVVRRDKFIDV